MAAIAWTTYGEQTILNWFLHKTQPPLIDIYLALFTSNPGETGTGTEISGGGYTRVLYSSWSAVTKNTAGTGSLCENNTAIAFPLATANQGTVTHIGFMDSLTGGDMYAYGALTTPQVIDVDQNLNFEPKMLQFIVS